MKANRYTLAAIMLVGFVSLSASHTSAAAQAPNELDTTEYAEQVEEYGIPTRESVAALGEKAKALFDAGDYAQAEPALAEWAHQANWLSNIIVRGLEPFYSAGYDDRKAFPAARIRLISPYERMANEYKTDRNHALVMQAECLVRTNQPERAVSVYMKALDIISVKDWEWWNRAANGLYGLVGVAPIPAK